MIITLNKKNCLWTRLFWTLLCFVLINIIARFLLLWTTVIQWLFFVLNGQPNTNLKLFSNYLNDFCYYSMQYVTFNREEAPFPLDKLNSVS